MCTQQLKASVALLVSSLAGTILWGCGGGSVASPPPVLSISFDGGSSQSVTQGGAITITAIVQNDPSAQGVTWKLTGPGNISKQTKASVEYDAPATVASNMVATVTATAVTDVSKTAATTVTVTPPISVTLSATVATVATNGFVKFSATLQNDVSNKGVTWKLSQGGTACSAACGSVSPAATVSDALVTYTAPANVPANPAVTLTATSVADPSKAASAVLTISLPAITVSVSPGSALLGVNLTQQFTATVKNDPANKGVTWSLRENEAVCSSGCGTLSANSSASGTAITYTAPATVPSAQVSLLVTPVADMDATVGVSITIALRAIKIAPVNLNFGHIVVGTSSDPQTTTLTNGGTKALIIAGISSTGSAAPDFSQTNNCGSSLASGQSCTITVVFKPSARGPRDAAISVSDDSTTSPEQILLTGKGVLPTAASLRLALSLHQVAMTPAPTGPSRVGTRVMNLMDVTRDDPFLSDGSKRELPVRFWYPTSLTDPCQPAEYTTTKVWNYFSELANLQLPEVTTNSCWNAPVSAGTHPVIVFTHGYTGTFTDSTFLFEDLASRGYVVASVGHTYESTAVEFPDGRFIKSALGSHFVDSLRGDEQTVEFAVSTRLRDLKFVVNELERQNARTDSVFAGMLDLAHLAIAGHSLGGLVAILEMDQDRRFKIAITINGVLPGDLNTETQSPLLMIRAGKPDSMEDQCVLKARLRGLQSIVNLPGTEHITPTDAVWLAKGAVKTGNMTVEDAITVLRDQVATFVDVHLRGQSTAVPLAKSAAFSEVVVANLEQSACSQRQ